MVTIILLISLALADPSKAEITEYAISISTDYDIDSKLIRAMIQVESEYDPCAESVCGAIGLMQIVEKYHVDRMDRLGVTDLKDPYSNILVGTDYIAELIEKHGNVIKALMIYNMGGNGADLYDQGIISEYARSVMNEVKAIRRKQNAGINNQQTGINHMQF